jgi:hypothetical protein
MSVIVGVIALLVLAGFAVRAGREDGAAEPDPVLAAAVDAHWDRTGEHPVWRGADFKRPVAAEDDAK